MTPTTVAHSSPCPALLRAAAALGLALALACGGASMEEIRALQDAGAYGESVDALRDILNRDPDHAEANYRLGLALLRTGQPARALWPLRKAADTEEYARPAGLMLVSTLFSMQNYEEAVAAATRVLEKDPENEAALLARSRAALDAREPELALEDARRLSALNPESLEAVGLAAAALSSLNRWEEAQKAFEQTYEMAKEQDSPFVARACIVLAKHWAPRGDPEKAAAGIERCLETHADDPTVTSLAVAAYDEIQKPAKATELLRKAVDENPEDANLRAALAQRLASSGAKHQAETLLEEGAEQSQSPALWLSLARSRRESRDFQGALEALEKAEALTPAGPGVKLAKAEILIELGRLDEAEAVKDELDEKLYRDLVDGRLALERGDPQRALELLEPAIVQWPNNEAARMWAARAASEIGDVERAMRQLREATRIAPEESDGSLLLARLHLAQGEPQTALEFAARHLQQRGFTGPEGHLLMARAAAQLDRRDQARDTLDQLAKFPGMAAIAAAERGQMEANWGGPEAGIRAIQSADLDLGDPSSAPALLALLELQLGAGHGDQAVREVRDLLGSHPESARLHALLGHVQLRLGRLPSARDALAKAIELDPEDGLALAGQGQIARAEGRFDEALELFDRAFQAEPDRAGFAYAAAQCALSAGRRDEAESRLKQLVHSSPELPGPANDLAFLLAERGESLDFALLLARRAEATAHGPEVLDTLGYVHLRRGDLDEAEKTLRESLVLNPQYATARYHLGLVLAERGDKDGALEALRAAVAQGAFPEVQEARTEIARLERSGE